MMTCNGTTHNPSLKQIREMATIRKTEGECVEKYHSHVSWLRDRKFLSDLESDSVDSEILEEELSTLQDDEACSTKQKVAKYLRSHPVQVILCVVVILDAGIVIAQILLDLHYFREKHYSCEQDISTLLSYLQSVHGDQMAGLDSGDIHTIVRRLRHADANNGDEGGKTKLNSAHLDGRHISDDIISSQQKYSESGPQAYSSPDSHTGKGNGDSPKKVGDGKNSDRLDRAKTDNSLVNSKGGGSHKRIKRRESMKNKIDTEEYSGYNKNQTDETEGSHNRVKRRGNKIKNIDTMWLELPKQSKDQTFKVEKSNSRMNRQKTIAIRKDLKGKHQKGQRGMIVKENLQIEHYDGRALQVGNSVTKGWLVRRLLSENGTLDYHSHHREDLDGNDSILPERHHKDIDVLHDVAHSLHIASICILGVLVVEDLVKAVAMGRDFCRHKVEVFDAVIILSSFVMDIVILGGVPGDEGERAAAVLVVLLLWRIARVVDGIVMTVKQKQEFRIRLQKRARRRAEKRIDNLEEDRHFKTRHVHALQELCQRSGVQEEEIEACIPKKRKRTSSTASALTSVARLSVSMTMSMSSGLFSLADDSDKLDEFTGGKSPDIAYARWKRDSTPSQEDGISLDFNNKVLKSSRGMSLPDFRTRSTGLMASPCKKDLLYSPSPTGLRREQTAYSPGQSSGKREMLYNTGLNSTIKEESPGSSRGNSTTTSPVNAAGIQIFIDTGSDHEDCSTIKSCDASCDSSVSVTSPEVSVINQPLMCTKEVREPNKDIRDSQENQGHLLMNQNSF